MPFQDPIENGELGLTARQKINSLLALTTNRQTGTAYTLALDDYGKLITLNNGSAITVTVPSGLGEDWYCILMQKGAGAVTVVGDGAAVHSFSSLTLSGQYATASLYAYDLNVFVLSGMIG